MRKINKWLATLLAVLLVAGCLPLSALAEGEGTGMSADDPIIIPTEGLAINGSTLYGIDKTWFEDNDSDDGHLYVSFSIPSTITQIADNAFRDNFTSNKRKYGAVNTTDNKGKSFDTVAIDFSEATSLETIGSQASYQCAYLKGELDLSGATNLEVIEKSAFNGCTGLTGVILPNSLTALGSADSGSVFNRCTGLKYIRRASSSEDAVFELPESLTCIGRQTFKSAFAADLDVRVVIPENVDTIGSEAFYSPRISQIVVSRQGDGWDTEYGGYDSQAFKTGNSNMLVIFRDNTSYQDYSLNRGPINAVKNAMTFPITLKFEGIDREEQKLNHQSIQYEPIEGTCFWMVNPDYKLPDLTSSPAAKPGYNINWMLGNQTLTDTGKLSTNQTKPKATVSYSLQEPEVAFSVDGIAQEGNSLTVKLDDKEHTAGVKVSHPLLLEEQGTEDGEYVYFKYCWWDEFEDEVNGPRSEAEPEIFSTSEGSGQLNRVKTDKPEIPIKGKEHERTDSGQYMVEIYGYIVRNNEEPELFYKSHYNFIDFGTDNDTEATTNRSYVFHVTVQEPTQYTITYNLDGGTLSSPNPTTYTEYTPDITLNNPTRSGYNFAGWTMNDGDTPQKTMTIKKGTTGNLIFTAHWEEISVTPPPIINPPGDDDDQPEDPDDTGVSDLLNTKDHDQYLFGYPDGTFGPGLNMTRAEAAQMFYNLLVDQDVTAKPVFDDVPEEAWYAEPVNVMAKLDIVEGVGDNKFEPDREITRAEFTAMAMRFAEGETGGKNIFSDVDEDDWFYDVVVDSIKYGWIEGYPDGTFRPQNLITREEVTTIVNRMLGRLPDEYYIDAHEDDLDLFPDVTKNWAYYDVVEATNDHQYKKTSSGEDWTKLG